MAGKAGKSICHIRHTSKNYRKMELIIRYEHVLLLQKLSGAARLQKKFLTPTIADKNY